MASQSQLWFLFAVSLVLGSLIYLLSPVLTPFIAGALLAYLGDPLVDRIEAWRMPRTLSVVIVFVFIFGVLALLMLLLVPLAQSQFTDLMRKLPQYIEWLNTHLRPWLHRFLASDVLADNKELNELAQQYLPQAGGIAANTFKAIFRSGAVFAHWLAMLLLIPVVTFYMLRDWGRFIGRIHEFIPRSIEPTIVSLAHDADDVLSAFLRGQFMVMLALGTIYSTGLWLIGLEFALLIGMLAGLISFIPYLGTLVGLLVSSVALILQTQDWVDLWKVGAVFLTGQILEGYLLTPWLVGDRIGLHPVAVIFAVLAGGQLFGFLGVLMALPFAAVLSVLLRFLHERYRQSKFYDTQR